MAYMCRLGIGECDCCGYCGEFFVDDEEYEEDEDEEEYRPEDDWENE